MPALTVLVIHNRYQQRGGEDAMVHAEVEQLRSHGHRVIPYTRENDEISRYGSWRKASLPLRAIWSHQAYRELHNLIRRERPDIAHFHNFFPLISPAAHYACKAAGLPVLQTLHNYRLTCPGATLFTSGQRCRGEACAFGALPWRRCYRNSRLQTAAVSAMLASHRVGRTWQRCVDAYLVPSGFCRDYFVGAGLPDAKVHIRPNFLPRDPGERTVAGDYALYVGRLSPEKGVLEMVEAWKQLPQVPLNIAGDGPLRPELQKAVARAKTPVQMLGQLTPEETIACIKKARFLIFPSRWYEPFGMGLLEAAACGVPAVASRIGAIPELVAHRKTGLLSDPDNIADMVASVRWAWSHPRETEEMGRAARRRFLELFSAERSYECWMNVCQSVLH